MITMHMPDEVFDQMVAEAVTRLGREHVEAVLTSAAVHFGWPFSARVRVVVVTVLAILCQPTEPPTIH